MDQIPGFIALLKEMPRPETDEYFLLQAAIVATRATCPRRRAGCVLTDRFNKVIATGYNGNAASLDHCLDNPCPGRDLPSGEGLSLCEALHAEENALIQCTRPNEIDTCYSVSSPCIHCLRRLMNTGCRRIVFAEVYPHSQCEDEWLGRRKVEIGGVVQYIQIQGRGVSWNGKREWIHRPWNSLPSIANTALARLAPGPSSSNTGPFDTVMLSWKGVQSPGSKTPSS